MNTPSSPWYEVRAQAEESAPVEIYIYDAIYDSGCEFYGGVCPPAFVEATAAYRARDVTLRINSPGGSAFAGVAIANYLRTFPKLSAVVDGLAASAASIVFMAAPKERRSLAAGAFLMIHEPAGISIGPAAVHEKNAADLRKIGEEIAAVYARDTGQTVEQAKAWMADETWFNGEDAKGAGFVSSVSEIPAVQMSFDLTNFRHPPADLRNTMNPQSITACGCQNPAARSNPNPPTEDIAAVRAERDALKAENDRLKNADRASRKARALAAVDAAIGTGALPSALREAMISRYEDDEEATVAVLAQLRPPGPGVAPIRARNTTVVASVQDLVVSEPDPRKRIAMAHQNWSRFIAPAAA
jgi:ATP-dependent Clp protease protease subunit